MNIPNEILLAVSSFGAIQSGFFSAYLLGSTKRRDTPTKLLGFLLLALSIRMAKSVGWYFSGDNLPAIIENIGYAAHIAIAPLLYLYVKAQAEENFTFRKQNLIHLVPAFMVLALSPFLDDWFWLRGINGYFWSLIFFGAYFPFIYPLLAKAKKADTLWLLLVTFGLHMVWAAYTANYVFGLVSYITAPAVFSLVICAASFFALVRTAKIPDTELVPERYKNSALTNNQLEEFSARISCHLSDAKAHRDPRLTLPKFSKGIGLPVHTVSEVINRHFKISFAELINSYRLIDAERMLRDPQNADEKIAAISYRSGFGAISGFNTAFKKRTGFTPSEYRKKYCR